MNFSPFFAIMKFFILIQFKTITMTWIDIHYFTDKEINLNDSGIRGPLKSEACFS